MSFAPSSFLKACIASDTLASSLDRLFIRTRRCFIPMPGIPERLDLGLEEE